MSEKPIDKNFESINMAAELISEDFKNINTMGKIAIFWLVLEIVLLALGG